MKSSATAKYNRHHLNELGRNCYFLIAFYALFFSSNVVKSEQHPFLLPLNSSYPTNNSTTAPGRDHHRSGGTRLDTSAELVLGTFAQEQDNAWFYETYYPIILKLPIPDWSPELHRLNRSAPKCENDDSTPNFLCPSQLYLDILLNRLSHNTRFFKKIFFASIFATENDDMFFEENPSCTNIKPHFYHFYATPKGMESYLDYLRQNCPLAKNLQMVETTVSSSADIAQAKVRQAYERFTTKHYANKPSYNLSGKNLSGKTEWEFAQTAAFTTFQNTYNLFTYGDSVRWSNAYKTCQSYRLDVNLIPPQMLINILTQASSNMTRLGLEYNISVPLDRLISHFYKLPLTDCILVVDNTNISKTFLALRLLVPATRIFKTYQVVKMNKIPFFIRNSQTDPQNEGASICEIKNYEYEESFLVEYDTSVGGDSQPEMTSVVKAPFTCGPYRLCRIPDTVHNNLADSCVEGIISRNENVTKDLCGFRCYPLSKRQIENEFPYVVQLTSNRFAVVGAMLVNETRGEKVSIKCFEKTKIDKVTQEKNDEATIITLPCTCYISTRDYKFSPEYPCNSTLEIIHVTHVLGDGYSKFKLFEGAEKSKNMQDVMMNRNNLKRNKSKAPRSAEQKEEKSEVEPARVDEQVELMEAETEESAVEFNFDGAAMFSTPYAVNKKGELAEKIMVVVNASGGNGNTHVIMWILGFVLLISDIVILYNLYKNGYVSLDDILFMR